MGPGGTRLSTFQRLGALKPAVLAVQAIQIPHVFAWCKVNLAWQWMAREACLLSGELITFHMLRSL